VTRVYVQCRIQSPGHCGVISYKQFYVKRLKGTSNSRVRNILRLERNYSHIAGFSKKSK
jgi:hypothetical protein